MKTNEEATNKANDTEDDIVVYIGSLPKNDKEIDLTQVNHTVKTGRSEIVPSSLSEVAFKGSYHAHHSSI